jgi:hypothetical protein
VDNRRLSGDDPVRQENQAMRQRSSGFNGAARFIRKSGLLNPCAAALNQNHQNDHKQHARNYPDNCGTVHCGFLPLRKS